MRLVIFAEAIRLQQYLTLLGTWHNKVIFEFTFPNEEKITTEMFIKANCTKLVCTCKQGSINYDSICSHKLAIIFYFFKKQMKRLKEKW